MFNFLKGKKDLIVTCDRADGVYYPGETVGIVVEIQPDKDLKVQSAQVALRGTEAFEYTTTDYHNTDDNNRDATTSGTGYQTLFESVENFLGEVTLPGGVPQRYTFQMPLPPDALPSCEGKILRVFWQVSVKLERRMARDPLVEVAVRVLSRAPGLKAQPGEYGESDDPGEADLSFSLPGLEAVAGQSLSGQLHILPRQNFTAKVRLELARHEDVPYDRGRQRDKDYSFDVAGNTEFIAGQPQSIPFQITVPPDVLPSLRAPHGSLTWTLKGILARGLAKGITIAQPIEVYTAAR